MKTQIIQLEPHDDTISIKDKMEWGQTPRILLVWPERGKILSRQLDLVLLKRHCTSLGAQLAFVTRDSEIAGFAKKLDIPVYANTRKAEQSHWRRPRRRSKKQAGLPIRQKRAAIQRPEEKPDLEKLRQKAHPGLAPWIAHPITRILFFTLGVVGVLAIVGILFPSAQVKLQPKTKTDNITIHVTASPEFQSVTLSGNVPAERMTIIIEGRSSRASSGTIRIPSQISGGRVIFTNLTDREITIPSGTIVSTGGDSPIRFVTQGEVNVPPKSESAEVNILAAEPGREGNVESEEITAVEGPLGLEATVINPARTSGGADQIVSAPSEEDYQLLIDQLIDTLEATAQDELSIVLSQDDVLLAGDKLEYQVLESRYTPEKPQPSDILELTARIEYAAFKVTGQDLYQLAKSGLEASLPENYSPEYATLSFASVSTPNLSSQSTYNWDMTASWEIHAGINTHTATNLVLWKKPGEAITILEKNLPIENNADIQLTPAWWPRLPIMPFRVNVVTE